MGSRPDDARVVSGERRHAATSAPGEVIGEYRVERVLGEGGMGAVYAAVHSVIDKRVALKVLRRELSTNPTFFDRFVKEARATNRIGHPNIVDVFGFGMTPDGRAYLAMELLEGRPLSARLASGRIEIAEACDIAIEISYALEAAHAAGIVHRDLKPDNVFLASMRGRTVVKLLDFGIAKLSGEGMNFTQPGVMIGTPTYIAPEQAKGEPIDGRADIYAFGVMLFEMLVGHPPFAAEGALELVMLHITEPPPVPSELEPRLPSTVDRLLAAMLHKAPAARPPLASVRSALEALRVETGAGESGIAIPVQRPRGKSPADLGETTQWMAEPPPRRWPIILFGLLALAIGFGLVVTLWPRG